MLDMNDIKKADNPPLDVIVYIGHAAPRAHPDIIEVTPIDTASMDLVDLCGWQHNDHYPREPLRADAQCYNVWLASLRGYSVRLHAHVAAVMQDAVKLGDSHAVADLLSDTFTIEPRLESIDVQEVFNSIFHEDMLKVGNIDGYTGCFGVPTNSRLCNIDYFPRNDESCD